MNILNSPLIASCAAQNMISGRKFCNFANLRVIAFLVDSIAPRHRTQKRFIAAMRFYNATVQGANSIIVCAHAAVVGLFETGKETANNAVRLLAFLFQRD